MTRALEVLAAIAVTLAVAVGYVAYAVVDADQFANRATAALRDDRVRDELATRIADRLVAREPDVIAARPLLESLAGSLIGSPGFTSLFRAGVRDLHRAALTGDRDTVTLTLADVGVLLATAVRVVRPELADRVAEARPLRVVRRDLGRVGGRLTRGADLLDTGAWILAVLAVVALAAAVAVSRERRRTAVRLGVGAAIGGIALVALLVAGRAVALAQVQDPGTRTAAGAVWDALLGDLRTLAWLLAGAGAVLAAAAASILRPVDVAGPLRTAAAVVVREPDQPRARALRGAALVAVGILLLIDPGAVLRVLATAAGVLLVYAGVAALLRLVQPTAPLERAPARPRARRRLVPAVALAVVALATAAVLGSGTLTEPAPAAVGCNGHVELCDRPLTALAVPTTHNSMSVPLPGWYAALQEAPIAEQLADGIRGLQLDTYYADRLPSGRLRTDLGDLDDLRARAREDGLSEDAIDAALRIRERLGFAGEGERGMYLCHSFCEIGGTRLDEVLADLREFLVANPGEVVVVINQDSVTPEDFVAAVRDAELEDLAFVPPAAGPWPALGEMIAQGKRLVLLAENEAGAAPWYQLAYAELVKETPYSFARPPQLIGRENLSASCAPNRGPEDAPLFLVNHWVTTDPLTLPSLAARVNAYGPLIERLERCAELRDHMPNLVAVNFYRRGALMEVVDELNGVE